MIMDGVTGYERARTYAPPRRVCRSNMEQDYLPLHGTLSISLWNAKILCVWDLVSS